MSGAFSVDLSPHSAVRYTFPLSPQGPHLEEADSNFYIVVSTNGGTVLEITNSLIKPPAWIPSVSH